MFAGLVLLAFNSLGGDILPGYVDSGLYEAFVLIGLIVIALAVLLFVAGAKSGRSRGWNIFLIVLGGIGALGSLSTLGENAGSGILSLVLNGLMLTFAILNVVEYNKLLANSQGESHTPEYTAPSHTNNALEKRLKELDDLKARGIINEEEYQDLRTAAINKTL